MSSTVVLKNDTANIENLLNILCDQNAAGEIACLLAVVVAPNGTSARHLVGGADEVVLLGSLELLKATITSHELSEARCATSLPDTIVQ
jgi:hypothetical protein